MTIKQFVKKAEKGGYKVPDLWFSCGGELAVPQMLLDPKCWQAVGKIEKWNEEHSLAHEYHDQDCCLCKMLAMIDELYEGKSIKEYIKTL